MVVHAFNSSPQETETGNAVFKVSLVCIASTRLAILFLDIYQIEMKTYIFKKNLCTNIHNQYSDTCVQCQQMRGKKIKSLRADWATRNLVEKKNHSSIIHSNQKANKNWKPLKHLSREEYINKICEIGMERWLRG